jgi:hypothetical protein
MIFWISIAASRRSCWLRMCGLQFVDVEQSLRPSRAISTVRLARISAMTSSSMLSALTRPRSRWAFFSSLVEPVLGASLDDLDLVGTQ